MEKKESLWGEKLTEGLPENFIQFTKLITDMEFDSEPDYDQLINLMRDLTIYNKEGEAIE